VSKNGNNEGSIRKRKNGTWEARYTIGYNSDGKQIQKSIYGKTRSAVSQKLNEIISSLRNGTYIEQSQITLSDWLNDWLTTYAVAKVRQSTYASYQSYINNHISPVIGGVALQNLTTSQLQLFFNDKYKSGRMDGKGGLSAKTIKNIANMLHEALQQAEVNKILLHNVAKGVVLPKRNHNEIIVFTPDEQSLILKNAKTERLGFAIVLDFATGLRIGELCGLKWSDFDFDKMSFRVCRTIQRIQNKQSNITEDSKRTVIVEGDVKTESGFREIPLSRNIFLKLLKYKESQDKEKSLLGKNYNYGDYVFSNPLGGFVEPSLMRDVYSRILKKANVRHLKFHTIRHTFATRAIEKGAPVKVVSEILGHSSVQVTMDLYCHPSIEAKRNVIEIMEGI